MSGCSFDRKHPRCSSQRNPLPVKCIDLWVTLTEASCFPLSEKQAHSFQKAQSPSLQTLSIIVKVVTVFIEVGSSLKHNRNYLSKLKPNKSKSAGQRTAVSCSFSHDCSGNRCKELFKYPITVIHFLHHFSGILCADNRVISLKGGSAYYFRELVRYLQQINLVLLALGWEDLL